MSKATVSGFKSSASLPVYDDERRVTSTVFGAIHQLNQHRKALFLLDTFLALIEAGT